MYGRYQLPDNLPRLYTYQDALNRYNETTPLIRGDDKGLMPLGGNRRYKRSQILKNSENGNIICRYWNTDVITFKENGEVDFYIGEWATPTTLMFLRDVYGMRFTRYKNKIYFDKGEKHYLIHFNKTLTIKDNEPVNPLPEYAMKLNRGRMKDKQKQFAPFIGYTKAMVQMETPKNAEAIGKEMESLVKAYGDVYFRNMLLAGNWSRGNTHVPTLPTDRRDYAHRPQHTVTRREFFNYVTEACERNDIDAMYPMYFILMVNASTYAWSNGNYVYSVDKQRIKKYFDTLVKFEYNDLFDKEEQPLGTLVADSNSKYFV